MNRRVAAAVDLPAVIALGTGGGLLVFRSGTTTPPFENDAVFVDACQPIPIGTTLYVAPWKIKGSASRTEHISSIQLAPKGTPSPAIQAVGDHVRSNNATSPFGTPWASSSISGFDRSPYIRSTGLEAPGW